MTASGLIAVRGASERSLMSSASLVSDRHIGGFVLDPDDLDARFVVELFLDGYPARIARAQLYDDELLAQGYGDGCYRFVFGVDPEVLPAIRTAEVRLANSGELLGSAVQITVGPAPERRDGDVRWIGGLRLTGWISGELESDGPTIRALLDGVVVAESRADLWTHVGEGAEVMAVRAFDLHLPLRLADGRVRRVRVVGASGRDLPGSPCPFVAFENGLARFLEGRADIDSERLRGELFDRLIPQSIPFFEYASWARSFPPDLSKSADEAKIAVALVGDTNLAASIKSLEAQVGRSWIAGALPDGDGQSAFINEDLRQFLSTDAKDCEIVVFALCGAVFHPFALNHMAVALVAFPDAKLAYCDFTTEGADGAEWPIALTAFDYERMLEQGYPSHIFAARASYAREAAAKGVSDLYRLFNMSMDGPDVPGEKGDSRWPVHAPGFVARLPRPDVADGSVRLAAATQAHLETRGARAEVKPAFGTLFPAVRVERFLTGAKVSILIPTRDRVDLLRPCLESLEKTVKNIDVEIIVVDNDSASPETLAFLDEIASRRVRVAYCSGPFNFSRVIDAAASVATGQFLLLLNNDIEAMNPGWLEEMLGRMAERDVGAVGALLLRPSGVVQHGGVVLGESFAAGHAFSERIEGDPGYSDLLVAAHECSAVTAACMLTRRRLFLDLGGFDGMRFPINYNDIDFCLRLREHGYRVVFTPHAKLRHHELASRGREPRPDQADRRRRELYNLRSIWGETLWGDPYYSPLLSLDGNPYTGLAWPPRSLAPRLPRGGGARMAPPGF